MNFFRAQRQARSASSKLLVLFIIAVIAITMAIALTFYLVFGHHEAERPLFSAIAFSENFGLIGIAAIGTVLFISGASFFRIASLHSGGGQVARDLGGDRVSEDTTDPQLKRLRNVVEEIAIASGVPVPEIYVLEQESGINAFAAGSSITDAAVAVTRGTLDHLSRDELQGVIAHEFSHILNGDMRLNLRLLGLLFGITAVALVGRKVLYHFRYTGGSRRGTGGVMLVALALVVVGSVGLFFARWIKAAVSRQRETLADASAVQFTRNPQGIAGALKKIAAASGGSQLAADSEEVDHMLFSNGRIERLFATHPPLVERIRSIEPGFQPGELKRIAANMQRKQAAETAREETARTARPGRAVTDPRSIMEGIGHPQWQQILYAAVLAQAMPDNLAMAARTPQKAPVLIFYLLLSSDHQLRENQLLELARRGGEALESQVRALHQLWGTSKPEQRLPLLEMAMPALKRRPRRELLELLQTIEHIAPQQGVEAIFPFMLSRVLHLYLEETLAAGAPQHPGRRPLARCRQQAALVLALVARFEDNLYPAEHAYRAGFDKLELGEAPPYAPPKVWSQELINALTCLDRLRPDDKERLVEALLAVAFNDREVNVNELELIRAICATLHVPLPPVEVTRAGA